MYRTILSIVTTAAVTGTPASTTAGTKVLYVDSYHEGDSWSDGIARSIVDTIGDAADVTIVRMDTKRNTDEAFKNEAAADAKAIIEQWRPDVVIVSDDNASKYLVMPHYRDADLPFVFCGVDWDATVYGYPYDNATGMVEVTLVEPMLEVLAPHVKGTHFGILAGDNDAARTEAGTVAATFELEGEHRFVKTFADWKAAFVHLQSRCDVLMLASNAGIDGWDDAAAEAWVFENTRIPTCTSSDRMTPYCVLGYLNDPAEHGEWAARAALAIAGGVSPVDIPIAVNERGRISINTMLSSKLGIRFPLSLVKRATLLRPETMTATAR